MLIPIYNLKQEFNLKINGILHVGAHECEELKDYNRIGIKSICPLTAVHPRINP